MSCRPGPYRQFICVKIGREAGALNQAGLDYCRWVLDMLLENGIKLVVTSTIGIRTNSHRDLETVPTATTPSNMLTMWTSWPRF